MRLFKVNFIKKTAPSTQRAFILYIELNLKFKLAIYSGQRTLFPEYFIKI